MDFFADTLLRLADPADIEDIVSAAEGMDLLQAVFDLSGVDVVSVDGVSVSSSRMLPMVPESLDGTISVRPPGAGPAWEGQARLLRYATPGGFDAELSLVVSTSTRTAKTQVRAVRVEELSGVFDMATVDSRIEAEDGDLPDDPQELERRRREALLATLLDEFEQPDDWDPDDFLREMDERPVAEIVARMSLPTHPLRASLDLEIVPDEGPKTLTLRFDLYVAVSEAPFDGLAELLGRIRAGRGPLSRSIRQPAPPQGVALRHTVPVGIVCPEAAFDDDDLPLPEGDAPDSDAARREARRREVNRRFRRTGIAFLTA